MKIIGLIAEYNPFHNGHLYQINKIKELYPDSIIILVLNGYFLERGLISIETKEEKVRLALKYGIDIAIELPFVFGTNSSDTFATMSLELLNALNVDTLIFGSESNDLEKLKIAANFQNTPEFSKCVKEYLDQGINYPTALNKANIIDIKEPNDLLGLSYIKAINNNNYKIEPISIKRTNDYHDDKSNEKIVSSTNIREKIKNNINIEKFIPEGAITSIDEELFFKLLKYKIISDENLEKYLTVDEGIQYRLKKVINKSNNLEELIENVKSKRYTYNRIMRMFIHILIGLTKEDKQELTHNEYIRILGFSENGNAYLNKYKKISPIPLVTKITSIDSKIKDYEFKAAEIYSLLTNTNVMVFEYSNKPIKRSSTDK